MAQETDKNKQRWNQENQSSNQGQSNPSHQPGKSGSQQEQSNPQDVSKKNPGQHGSQDYNKTEHSERDPKRHVS
ncbi:MAG: hypothetical protein ACRD2U_04200 [Terriglobales bacterium]